MPASPLQCVVSVSGIRGIIGDTLTTDQVLDLAAAFGAAVAGGGPVVVGRDSRSTGELLVQAVSAGLRGVGCDVIDLGMVPTPTVAIMVGELRAAGGIQVSASHNTAEWNALKFFNREARNVDGDQLDWILNAYSDPPRGMWRRHDGIGSWRQGYDVLGVHLRRVLAAVDAECIRAANISVVVDSVNGAGSTLAPELLSRLGCQVLPIYNRPDLPFPRDPEPTAANVTATGKVVAAVGAQVGFVQDPDADRLAIIDDLGRYIGEEYTLVLCAMARFLGGSASGRKVIACTNLSTSRMLDDVAARHGAEVVRTRVGEAHVVDAMQRHQALVGGEGNGGVIDPRVVLGRDSQVGMALVLELLARSGKKLSEIVDGIPRYAMHKRKVAMDRSEATAAASQLAGSPFAAGSVIDRQDGIKLSWPDRWVHVRASGTEPLGRVIAEAPDAATATRLVDETCDAAGLDPTPVSH